MAAQLGSMDDFTAFLQAYAMIQMGGRTKVVEAMTGVPKSTIRRFYAEVHGKSPPSGLHKTDAKSFLQDYRTAMEATLAAITMLPEGGTPKTITPKWLLESCHSYIALSSEPEGSHLDINDIWLLAQSLRDRQVALRNCRRCITPYLGIPYPYPENPRLDTGYCTPCRIRQEYYCSRCGTRHRGLGVCPTCTTPTNRAKETAGIPETFLEA